MATILNWCVCGCACVTLSSVSILFGMFAVRFAAAATVYCYYSFSPVSKIDFVQLLINN